jgi:hypothetical protein
VPSSPAAAAYHEAGHAVLAVLTGHPLKHVTIDGSGPALLEGKRVFKAGSCSVGVPRGYPATAVLRRVMTVKGGAAAQRRYCLATGADRDTVERGILEGLAPDRAVIDRDTATLTPGARAEMEARAGRAVEALLDRPGVWAAVEAVAEGLLEHGLLRGDQVGAIVRSLAADPLAMAPAPTPPPPSNPLLEQTARTRTQMQRINADLGLAIPVPSLDAIAGDLRVEEAGQVLLEANGPDYGPASVRLLEAFLGRQGPGRGVPLTETVASGVDEDGRPWATVEVLELEP